MFFKNPLKPSVRRRAVASPEASANASFHTHDFSL